jgi:hypothetical protein
MTNEVEGTDHEIAKDASNEFILAPLTRATSLLRLTLRIRLSSFNFSISYIPPYCGSNERCGAREAFPECSIGYQAELVVIEYHPWIALSIPWS